MDGGERTGGGNSARTGDEGGARETEVPRFL